MSELPIPTGDLRRAADAEDALERTTDGYVLLDSEYRFLYANPAGLRDMRKTMDELIGRVHWDVFPASYNITAGRMYRAAAETKVPQYFTEHYCYEGLDLHMEMSAYPTNSGGVAVFWKDVTDRVKAEQRLRDNEAILRDRFAELDQVYRYAPVGLCTFDRDLRFTRVNERLAEINGMPADAHLGRHVWEMVPDVADETTPLLRHVLESGEPVIDSELSGMTPAQPGVRRHWLASFYPLRAAQGEIVGVIGAVLEVTRYYVAEAQLRESEERLRQSQKMQAVGQLAGGIAHDFNNLLTVIVGNLDFVRGGVPADSPVHPDLAEIATAADRARTLVRQLLTFSRKQRVQPRLVRANEVVRGMQSLLRRVIGEEITMEFLMDEGADYVLIDPGHLEQIVMNLVVNARHALLTPANGHDGAGGALFIEVTPRTFTEEQRGHRQSIPAGSYVALVVRDTGHGMTEETRSHLFEPFFTTKDVGAGTGLGLATVHGIVQEANGRIMVESEPGRGSSFTILLPAADARPAAEHAEAPVGVADLSGLTVLMVEDELPVRIILRRILEHHGARVLEARHGRDALAIWTQQHGSIDVVITDMRMPEMGGRELVDRLRADGSAVRVLFVSGYAEGNAQTVLGPLEEFVEKPFSADTLMQALNGLLARQAESDSAA